jgi:hypothetical protein
LSHFLAPSLSIHLSLSLSLFLSLSFSTVFESLMETALEENRRMNSDRAEAMLVRAYNMYRHPLLISLQTEAAAAALADPSSVSSTMFKGIHSCKLFSMYVHVLLAQREMP